MKREEASSVEDMAAYWFVTMRDADLCPEDAEAFSEWYQESRENRIAYDELEALWSSEEFADALTLETGTDEENGPLENVVPLARPALPVASSEWMLRKIAAAAAVFLFITAGLLSSYGDFWFADYRTASGETRQVILSDSSTVTLNTASALSVDFTEQERRISLYDGEAFFSVSKDKKRPFIVETKAGSVRVLGTAFSVRALGDDLTVAVTESRVEVTSPSGGAVILSAGQAIDITSSGMSKNRPLDKRRDLAWTSGRMVFENVPLRDVLAEISRYRQDRVLVLDERLGDFPVTATLSVTDAEAVLGSLKQILPVSSYGIPGLVTLLVPKGTEQK